MVSRQSLSALPIVGIFADGQTYRNLVYLLLALPLGFLYSTVFSFGFVFGFLLSFVLVGLVILFGTLVIARLFAGFERWLANRLLATALDPYDDIPTHTDGGLASFRKYVDPASTWRGVGFLSLKFFVSMLALVPVLGFAWLLPLIASPVRYPYTAEFGEANGEPVTWAIDTVPESLLAVLVGVVGLIVVFHVTNAIAYVSRRMAIALLGVERTTAAADEAEPRPGNPTDSPTGGLIDSPTNEPTDSPTNEPTEVAGDSDSPVDPDTDSSDKDGDDSAERVPGSSDPNGTDEPAFTFGTVNDGSSQEMDENDER